MSKSASPFNRRAELMRCEKLLMHYRSKGWVERANKVNAHIGRIVLIDRPELSHIWLPVIRSVRGKL